jgi:glycosyltransferase involved in cell wall biosynthesis
MAPMDKVPFFSIIISTRDRPELFEIALNSVMQQTFSESEIIVVIDGSSNANLALYKELERKYAHVTFFHLEHRPNGHGQSYTMNYGASMCSGQYLCFLDDDDHWIDAGYLTRLFESLAASSKQVDVHYSNQRAVFSNGTAQTKSVWLEDLVPQLPTQTKNVGDSYFVNSDFLLSSKGFAHLNCSVFERDFYNSIGGMDETIRYENDRDVYIRSIDAAKVILFSARYISVHNIPDSSKKSNMSTVSTEIDKKLYQLRVYDKGITLCQNTKIVQFCSKAKVYELKHAARILEQNGRYMSAAHFAKSALICGFNFGWMAYTCYLSVLAWVKPNRSHRDLTP